MLKRGVAAKFMPGVWVFAGGVVEDADRAGEPAVQTAADEWAHRVCGARELGEEAAIELEPAALLPWSRWITPEQVPLRFDTRFYVALAPPHCKPQPELSEMDKARWLTPTAGLEAERSGQMEISFPTVRHLEQLADFADADAVVEAAADRDVEALLPRIRKRGEEFDVLLPGDDGYEEA